MTLRHLPAAAPRTDWTRDEIAALFDLPFTSWCSKRSRGAPRASCRATRCSLHAAVDQDRRLPGRLRLLLAVVQADSGVKATKLMDVRAVLQAAAQAKDAGSGRFCMGAAWRNPKDRDMPAWSRS
jgi:biotin synthase